MDRPCCKIIYNNCQQQQEQKTVIPASVKKTAGSQEQAVLPFLLQQEIAAKDREKEDKERETIKNHETKKQPSALTADGIVQGDKHKGKLNMELRQKGSTLKQGAF
jgi:hypothetical protein